MSTGLGVAFGRSLPLPSGLLLERIPPKGEALGMGCDIWLPYCGVMFAGEANGDPKEVALPGPKPGLELFILLYIQQ